MSIHPENTPLLPHKADSDNKAGDNDDDAGVDDEDH